MVQTTSWSRLWLLIFSSVCLGSARCVRGLSLTALKRDGEATYGHDSSNLPLADDEKLYLGLHQEEYSVIFSGPRALWSSASNADCFKTVAAQIKGLCGNRMDVEQDAKVKAAIALTRCELATARLKPPLECDDIYMDNTRTRPQSERPATESSRCVASCVEALSRSTQYWATYSGYMRELPQLCYALSKIADEDVAQQIYRNVTQEKQALLRILRHHLERAEQRNEKQKDEHQKQQKVLQDLYHSLQSVLRDNTAVEHMVNTVQHEAVSMSETLISQLNHTAVGMRSDIAASLSSQLHELVSSLSQHSREVVGTQVRQGVERALSQQQLKIAPFFETHLPDLLHQLAAARDEIDQAAHRSSRRFGELHEEARSVHSAALSMASNSAQTGDSIRDIQSSLTSLVRSADQGAAKVQSTMAVFDDRVSRLEQLLQEEIEQRRELNERHRQYLAESQRNSLGSVARRMLGLNSFNATAIDVWYPPSTEWTIAPGGQQMLLVWVQRRALELLPTVFTTQFGHFLLLLMLAGGRVAWFLVSHLAAAVFIGVALTWQSFRPLTRRLLVWMSRPRIPPAGVPDLPLQPTSTRWEDRRSLRVSQWRSDLHQESSEEEVEELLTSAVDASVGTSHSREGAVPSGLASPDGAGSRVHSPEMGQKAMKAEDVV